MGRLWSKLSPGKLEGFFRTALGLGLAVHELPEAVVVRVVRAAAAHLQLIDRHHHLIARRVARLRARLLLVTLRLQRGRTTTSQNAESNVYRYVRHSRFKSRKHAAQQSKMYMD